MEQQLIKFLSRRTWNRFLIVTSQPILLHELMSIICQLPQLFFNNPKIQYYFDKSLSLTLYNASDYHMHCHSEFIKLVFEASPNSGYGTLGSVRK